MGHRVRRWLADACALIDFFTADPNFPSTVRQILEVEPESVAVAASTVGEIAIETARGKLADIRIGGHDTPVEMLQAHGFDLLPLDPATAEQAETLPFLHADPFDRALIAVAQRTGRGILTSDGIIRRYGVSVVW
ncbi:MAG: type II toxin-antitoxin system VapC family toxin [Geminicoccaceae bacterium]